MNVETRLSIVAIIIFAWFAQLWTQVLMRSTSSLMRSMPSFWWEADPRVATTPWEQPVGEDSKIRHTLEATRRRLPITHGGDSTKRKEGRNVRVGMCTLLFSSVLEILSWNQKDEGQWEIVILCPRFIGRTEAMSSASTVTDAKCPKKSRWMYVYHCYFTLQPYVMRYRNVGSRSTSGRPKDELRLTAIPGINCLRDSATFVERP